MTTESTDLTTPFIKVWQKLRAFVHAIEERITARAETAIGKEWLRYIFRITVLIGSVVLVLMTVNFGFMPWYVGHDQITRVPDVTGMSYNQALKILEGSGFSVKIAGEYYHNKTPAGHIVTQMPFAQSMAKSSRTIYLTLSRGQQLLEMPNLVGLSVRDARIALIRLGLSLRNASYEFNDYVAANVIFQQSIASKTRVEFGGTVDVKVSLGPEAVYAVLPDVEGKALEDAKNILIGAGFVIGAITSKPDETFVSNTVLKQIPAPNDSVKTGTAVNLIIAQ